MNIHKKFFSKIGVNYLILGAAALLFQILLFNILSVTNPEFLNDMNILSGLSSVCNYFLPFPIFYLLMKELDKKTLEKSRVGVKTFILYIAIMMTLMWIGNITGLIITTLLSGAIQSDIANPVQQLINSTDLWFNFLIVSIIGPACEEIIFRKFLIDRTIRYGARVSIVLSAVIFALFHGNLNQFFYAFLLGGFLAYVYIKTGRITYTIILHAIVNFMGSVVSTVFSNSVMNLQVSVAPADLFITLAYIIIVLSSLVIGIYGLIKIRNDRFNGEKTEIALKSPYKTVFLNYGMILFTVFYICQIIYQALI